MAKNTLNPKNSVSPVSKKSELNVPVSHNENQLPQAASEITTVEKSETQVAVPAKGLTRDRIEEMRNQLALLREFVAQVMIRGEHYGVIPGTQKPTLLKAGAEFLREAYGFEVKSQCVERKYIERDKDYIEYTYRVELFQNGISVGVCEGSCNNYERRYEKLSPFAVMNTIQKMAQKRAYVGAVISATRSSNIFTQDLEDEPELATGPTPSSASSPVAAVSARMASPGQAKLVWARLKSELALSDSAARDFIAKTAGKAHSRDLTTADIETLLDAIDAEAEVKKGKEGESAIA
jgi:hypothetical protein